MRKRERASNEFVDVNNFSFSAKTFSDGIFYEVVLHVINVMAEAKNIET